MDDEERTHLRDLVHRAHEALGEIVEMQARCPADVDRFDWSADLLDGLARVALQVGDAAASLSGSEDDELERRSRELATAIVRRRNEALIPVRMPRRTATRSAAASLLGSPRALT